MSKSTPKAMMFRPQMPKPRMPGQTPSAAPAPTADTRRPYTPPVLQQMPINGTANGSNGPLSEGVFDGS